MAEGLTFTYSIQPNDHKIDDNNWPNNRIVITHNPIAAINLNAQTFMSDVNNITSGNKINENSTNIKNINNNNGGYGIEQFIKAETNINEVQNIWLFFVFLFFSCCR